LDAEIVQEQLRHQDGVFNISIIKRIFNLKTNETIYKKIKSGMPAHKKPGTGYIFFKSDIIDYLKS
jgi:hypothetical protein